MEERGVGMRGCAGGTGVCYVSKVDVEAVLSSLEERVVLKV